MLPRLFCALDLVGEGVLTREFIDEVRESAIANARAAVLRGGTSTSLESKGTEVHYRLLDGNQISQVLPELDRIYRTTLVDIASRVSGVEVQPSPQLVNGININVLEGTGGRYEWHYDSNPVTGLLVLSECDNQRGGRLLFEQDAERQTAFCMRPGHFLVFDATKTPHAVEPLRSETARLTAPMNFFVAGTGIERPADLDSSLYETS